MRNVTEKGRKVVKILFYQKMGVKVAESLASGDG